MSLIFGLDSSGKTAGACVVRDGQILFEETLNRGLTHSETLLPLVEKALAVCDIGVGDVSLWAVTGGPGSFTGLRIGMALVKGLCLPYGTPAVAVSTMEALALGCGQRGTVITALDARRSQVYWAAFACQDEVRRLVPDSAGAVEELRKTVAESTNSVFFVGDGAELCYNTYNCEKNVASPPGQETFRIAWGAVLAAERAVRAGEVLSAGAMRPHYLRLSQAERERAEKQKIQNALGEG